MNAFELLRQPDVKVARPTKTKPTVHTMGPIRGFFRPFDWNVNELQLGDDVLEHVVAWLIESKEARSAIAFGKTDHRAQRITNQVFDRICRDLSALANDLRRALDAAMEPSIDGCRAVIPNAIERREAESSRVVHIDGDTTRQNLRERAAYNARERFGIQRWRCESVLRVDAYIEDLLEDNSDEEWVRDTRSKADDYEYALLDAGVHDLMRRYWLVENVKRCGWWDSRRAFLSAVLNVCDVCGKEGDLWGRNGAPNKLFRLLTPWACTKCNDDMCVLSFSSTKRALVHTTRSVGHEMVVSIEDHLKIKRPNIKSLLSLSANADPVSHKRPILKLPQDSVVLGKGPVIHEWLARFGDVPAGSAWLNPKTRLGFFLTSVPGAPLERTLEHTLFGSKLEQWRPKIEVALALAPKFDPNERIAHLKAVRQIIAQILRGFPPCAVACNYYVKKALHGLADGLPLVKRAIEYAQGSGVPKNSTIDAPLRALVAATPESIRRELRVLMSRATIFNKPMNHIARSVVCALGERVVQAVPVGKEHVVEIVLRELIDLVENRGIQLIYISSDPSGTPFPNVYVRLGRTSTSDPGVKITAIMKELPRWYELATEEDEALLRRSMQRCVRMLNLRLERRTRQYWRQRVVDSGIAQDLFDFKIKQLVHEHRDVPRPPWWR